MRLVASIDCPPVVGLGSREPTFGGRLALIVGLATAFGSLTLAGCGGKQGGGPQSAGSLGSNVPAAPSVDRSRCKAEGKQVVTADTNLDKKPDVWKYFVPNGQGAQVMTCKQVDLNHDSRVDIVYYYDQTGTPTLEEFDLDFDGRNDLTVYWVNGKRIREEMDTNYDTRPDFWKYYEDDKLVRIERDSDYNGRVDEWEYYEGGKLDRIGYDTSGSGRVDRWDRAPEGADDASGAVTPASEPGPGGAAPGAPAAAASGPGPATPAAAAPPAAVPAATPAKK